MPDMGGSSRLQRPYHSQQLYGSWALAEVILSYILSTHHIALGFLFCGLLSNTLNNTDLYQTRRLLLKSSCFWHRGLQMGHCSWSKGSRFWQVAWLPCMLLPPLGSAICGVVADGYHLQGCYFSLNLLFYNLDAWRKLSVAWLGCYLFDLLHS